MPDTPSSFFINRPGELWDWFGNLKKDFNESQVGQLLNTGDWPGSRLTVRTFPTRDPRFRFPETGHRRLRGKYDLGVAFSGGGTRSMSLSLGEMRALHTLGIEDKVKYIGAVSGGAWFAVPYTYLPKNISDDRWLGRHLQPESLTESFVRSTDQESGHGIVVGQITAAELWVNGFWELLEAAFKSIISVKIPLVNIKIGLDELDEVFSRLLESLFLHDIGLDGERYVGWSMLDDVDDVILRHQKQVLANPGLDRRDFVWVDRDRPYLLVNGAMNQDFGVVPDGSTTSIGSLTGPLSFEHVELTPLYTGIHRHGRGLLATDTGGGYVENIGWDTWLPVAMSPSWMNVSPGLAMHRLSLKDMMGTSGAAFAYVPNALPETFTTVPTKLIDIFPHFRTWSPSFTGLPVTIERPFGDGGYVDNYGIMPLLKRGVGNAIVFINTSSRIREDTTWPLDTRVDKQLPVLFGEPIPSEFGDLLSPAVFLDPERFFGAGQGQVFQDGYDETVEGFKITKKLANATTHDGTPGPLGEMDQAALDRLELEPDETADCLGKIRGPIYHLGDYTTVENEFFGITAGRRIRILWVYNEKSRAWRERLGPDVDEILGESGLASFPHVKTFFGGNQGEKKFEDRLTRNIELHGLVAGVAAAVAEPHEIIDLAPEQVNLMANLSAWAVLQLRGLIDTEILARARPRHLEDVPMSLRHVLTETSATSLIGAVSAVSAKHGVAFSNQARDSFRGLVAFLNR